MNGLWQCLQALINELKCRSNVGHWTILTMTITSSIVFTELLKILCGWSYNFVTFVNDGRISSDVPSKWISLLLSKAEFQSWFEKLLWKFLGKFSKENYSGWCIIPCKKKNLHIKRNWTFILKNSFHEVEKDGRVLKDTSFKLIHLYFRNI